MADAPFLNFDLQVLRSATGCTARVLFSPVGEAVITFDPAALDGAASQGVPMTLAEAQARGGQLFAAVFTGELLGLWRRTHDAARPEAQGVRLRVRVEDAAAARWPWEALWDAEVADFVALSRRTTVARYVTVPNAAPPLPGEPPVRLLFAAAAPVDVPPLDTEGEWERIQAALADAPRIQAEVLPHATAEALREHLVGAAFGIVHFAGHGIQEEDGSPALLLEGEDGSATRLDGAQLALLLGDQPRLRLLVLNACWGAAPAPEALAGVAQGLIRRGLGAVVAMQVPIADRLAARFAAAFYDALGKGAAVEAAVAEGRKALALADPSAAWCAPVLFLRAGDSRLFSDEPEEEEAQVVFEDVAGDVFYTPITVTAGGQVGDVTVGKNIIKIGRFVVPVWMFLAALALPFLLAGAAYLRFVPARMPSDARQFNIAVAEFGEQAGREVRTGATGQRLSAWVATGLEAEGATFADTFGNPLAVWHDRMAPFAKRRTIGVAEGVDEGARQAWAERLAETINANVVIYGVVGPEPDGREALSVEFYVRPDPTLQAAVETRVGHFRLGDPIPLPPNFDPAQVGTGDAAALGAAVTARGRALAWLLAALDRERRGNRGEMVAILERAARESESTALGRTDWPERGAGKEILYTMLGEARMELAYADTACADPQSQPLATQAEEAFQQALASNPSYFFADLGLGNVAHRTAQCLLTVELVKPDGTVNPALMGEAQALLDTALVHYREAERHAAAASDPTYATVLSHHAFATVHLLRALASVLQAARFDPTNRDAHLSAAEGAVAAGTAALAGSAEALPTDEHRLRAKGWLLQGNLLAMEGTLQAERQQHGACRERFEAAARAFGACEAEAKTVYEDVYLQQVMVPNLCTPQKQLALCNLDSTQCPEGRSTTVCAALP